MRRRRRRVCAPHHALVLLVVAAAAAVVAPALAADEAAAAGQEQQQQQQQQLRVGRAVDVFARYGYLSLSLKVVPRNNSAGWIFREPTTDVFTDVERYEVKPERMPKRQKRVFEGEFHMEFCDNARQLVQAYFRDFAFERLDRPWRAFTSSWAPETLAKHLGINSTFVHKEHCYVLVRLSRYRDVARLGQAPTEANLDAVVADEIEHIQVGNTASVLSFIRKYGSHYIDSYITGNSIYQVFVFNKNHYQQVKERLKTQGIAQITNMELNQYFSPWYAEHMGSIKVASGNKTVENWAASVLRHNYYFFTFPSLLKIHGDPKLLSKLNNLLRNEAILQMAMKTLAPAFRDKSKRRWFEEVLDNFSKLWESNL